MTAGKVIKCRAAVSWNAKEPLSLEEVQVSPPKAGEVRIKIVSVAICHTDANFLNGFTTEGAFPRILGHEGAGIVESVGEHVTEFKAGDHVIPLFNPQCNDCKYCTSRKTNICFKLRHTASRGVMPDGTTRFTCKGQQLYHFMGCSTFSEYTVVAEISLCKVNPLASLSRICLLGCGVSTGYGAALNTAKVEPGSTCAVFGLGAVGLSAGLGCAAAGAKRIIGIDINEAKFEISKKFGFTDFLNPNKYDQPIQTILRKMTDGGLDYTFECIGNVQTMNAALESCHNGWGVSVIFGFAATGQKISAKPGLLITGRTWKGTAFGGWRSKDDVPKLVEKYLNKEINLDDFVTAELPLDEINEGFELLRTGDGIRTIVNF